MAAESIPDPVESFIDAEFLSRLEKFRIATKRKVRKGPQRGEHPSWQTGEGLEFLDYRTYHPGDDLRYVDWSVYGRLDKLFIKLFHAEENQTVHLLLDISRSMAFGTPPKHIRAKQIAAAVSYICLSNMDKIGLAAFGDTISHQRSSCRGKRRYPEILRFLLSLEPTGETRLNTCLTDFAATRRGEGVVIIISDMFDPTGYREGLLALTYRKFDIHLVHVLDHEERFWSNTGHFLLTDMETGEEKAISLGSGLLAGYRNAVAAYLANLQEVCRQYGIQYYLHDTRMPFEEFLIKYLTKGSMVL